MTAQTSSGVVMTNDMFNDYMTSFGASLHRDFETTDSEGMAVFNGLYVEGGKSEGEGREREIKKLGGKKE